MLYGNSSSSSRPNDALVADEPMASCIDYFFPLPPTFSYVVLPAESPSSGKSC